MTINEKRDTLQKILGFSVEEWTDEQVGYEYYKLIQHNE